MLGAFLKSLRKGKNITQKQAGSLSGLTRNRVLDIEKAKYPYSSDKLVKYAGSLGYDLEIHFVDKEDKRNTLVYKP